MNNRKVRRQKIQHKALSKESATSFKDIRAIAVPPGGANVVAAAHTIAKQEGGCASALLIELQPEPAYISDGASGYVDGTVWEQVMEGAREGYLKNKSIFEAALAEPCASMGRQDVAITPTALRERIAYEARYADLSVVALPGLKPDHAMTAIFEAALFDSGRAVLVVPPTWRQQSIGKRIAVGWNGKREATRAIAAASSFFEAAETINILTVGWDHHGAADAADLAAHMARRGVKADAQNVDPRGRTDAEALLEACHAANADLLIVGGYGHSRMQEFVLGGVTRDLMMMCDTPLLMAH